RPVRDRAFSETRRPLTSQVLGRARIQYPALDGNAPRGSFPRARRAGTVGGGYPPFFPSFALVKSSFAHRVGRSFSAKPKDSEQLFSEQIKRKNLWHLPINVAFRDYLSP